MRMHDKTKAIVILYNGKQVTDEIVCSIVKKIIPLCASSTLPTVVTRDTDSISDALIQVSVKQNLKEQQENKNEPVAAALTYIGVQYAHLLSQRNYILLGLTLQYDLNHSGKNDALLNAITILATEKALFVPESFAKEYGITPEVINVIKEVYKTHNRPITFSQYVPRTQSRGHKT